MNIISGINDYNIKKFYEAALDIYDDKEKAYKDFSYESLKDFLCNCDEASGKNIFIAMDNDKAISRVFAEIDKDKNIAYINKFETQDNKEACTKLFDELKKWCKSLGVKSIKGPMTDKTTEARGILISGEGAPVFCTLYNKKYYENILLNQGFNRINGMVEFVIILKSEYNKLMNIKKFVMKKYPDLVIRKIDLDNFKEDIEKITSLYNEAWKNNWGFTPMNAEDMYNATSIFKKYLQYSCILELGGECVRFQMIIPDLNQCRTNVRIDDDKVSKIDTYRALYLGISPKYRSVGFESLLYNEVLNYYSKEVNIKKNPFRIGFRR